MTTITHTADGPRFDGMTVGELIAHLTNQSVHLMRVDLGAFSVDLDRAAAALRYLSEWQPIETKIVPGQAPWDGKEYLVCGVNADGDKWQAVGHWWSEDEGWHQEAIGEEIPEMNLYDPTCWRPLPPGPDGGGA